MQGSLVGLTSPSIFFLSLVQEADDQATVASTVSATAAVTSAKDEFPGSSQAAALHVLPPTLGVPGSVAQTAPYSAVQIAANLGINRIPMTAQAVTGQVKLDQLQQLQSPGMFPQAYIMANGHAQEYTQAAQVVGAAGQIIPPPVGD